ncbi:MAG: sodium:solute symporter [Gammaproteobacteria bacterium]|nr:sodium:solute symporter [Gammaproteobacteria bacterium]
MHPVDWSIVALYLAHVVWLGVKFSREPRDSTGFFLAGRSLPWWAVGLSVMATQMSAITLIGTTGQAYTDGMRFIQFYLGLPLAMIILCVTAVPFFYRAKVFTAYEYLEKRFDAKTRTLTSFFFLVSRGLGVGVIIAAPSVVLSIVLGWDEVVTIFVIGLSTTVYTMLGGVQAVTWTDVKQMFIIFAGLAMCVVVIISALPGSVTLGDALHLAGASGKLQTLDFSFDLSERYTVWSGFIAALFLFLSYFGCDQSQVQRYLTARSVDEGRTSLMMSAFLKIPLQFLILLIGVLVFVFYQFRPAPLVFNEFEAQQAAAAQPAAYAALETEFGNLHRARQDAAMRYIISRNGGDAEDERAAYIAASDSYNDKRGEATEFIRVANDNPSFNDVNYVFPTFVINNMPIGAVGLIIAAILAAAMSSVAAELNSLATASTMDFYKRHFRRDPDESDLVRFGRIATLIWGIFACIVATFATNLGSLIEVVNTFGSFFYGSLLGVFVLAFAVPAARPAGAFYGLLFGIVSVWIASAFTDIAFLWFNVVGCLVTVAAGLVISRLTMRTTT